MSDQSNNMNEQASSNINETDELMALLASTLQLGEKIQKDKQKSDEEKRCTLNEIKNRIEQSMNKHRELDQNQINTDICDLKFKLQKSSDSFAEKMSVLESMVNSLGGVESTVIKLNAVKVLQTYFAKNMTDFILEIRDHVVSQCRNFHPDDDLIEYLNEKYGFDASKNELEKSMIDLFRDVVSLESMTDLFRDVISLVTKMDWNQNVVHFQAPHDQETSEMVENDEFLSAMETSAFDYKKFDI